jgi:hypothetical protein
MIEAWLPTIAIGGGFVLLLALVGIALWIGRRRRFRESPRQTSFHMTAIDPRIARHGRAAWERSAPPCETPLGVEAPVIVEEIDIPIDVETPPPDRTVIGYSAYSAFMQRQPHGIDNDFHSPRLARGSTPGIATPRSPALPARPTDWDLGAPSVTARMRAAKRT